MGRPHDLSGKLNRLRDGAAPRVVDLFAGCGGASIGFQRAGCHVVGGLEHEPLRALTYAANIHHREASEPRLLTHSEPRDVTTTDPMEWLRSVSGGETESVDLVIGGPPCQAYSRIGRAKLREIARHPRAFRRDPRGKLWASYVEFVGKL
jgi:DNA (cytosine-5)-methyltransferase 1